VEDIECDLKRFKVRSLVIRALKGSYLSKMLGDKKGVVIPFPMVHAVGDIIIIKHISGPAVEETGGQMPQATAMSLPGAGEED